MSRRQVDPGPEALCQGLVAHLEEQMQIHDPRILDAFRAVPRHRFVTHVSIEEAYRDRAIATKQLDNGLAISSASQPAMMAIMLKQLNIQPGHRILEIGAGTGYNAALMAHLVGARGHVVTIDFDEDIVSDARQHLAANGVENVDVIRADGGRGFAAGAPFDRIILTVGAWDIAPAWREQLTAHGRLVLPLSVGGPQLSVAFQAQNGHLISQSAHYCEFMRLRGEFAGPEMLGPLGPERGLLIGSEEALPVPNDTLYNWLSGPSQDDPAGMHMALRDLRSSLWLWLGIHETGHFRVYATGDIAKRGWIPDLLSVSVPGGLFRGTSGLVNEDGVCLLARSDDEANPFPLRLRSYGNAKALTQRLLGQLQAWDAAGRPRGDRLEIVVYPLEAAIDVPEGAVVIPKRWHQHVLRWP
ncbi:methyltransferase domain-containing protein [Candidatus Entotheonella palauensis]|uniref:Protein-L-isoaspartate O-methyltransferase n=1 Tax=Candidatus Entotheonella gemina TaxID=1429439 RepID=W4M5D1_9BACT|nr:methyltransferase domain-containing protein [Candidatus Entotheonella palauensis]ETX04822.1 MAG: protein-L-isoaspartate(D-aspartate) O-methyltransferase [Candidatus Entotheonella gemina]